MKPYERLEAWQAAHRLVLAIYRATRAFPKDELYGLTSQARRAAFSIAANIAEGSAKKGPREFRRYLDMAVGSLAELAYVLRVVKDLGLIKDAAWAELDALRDRAGRLTWGCMPRSVVRQHVLPNTPPPVCPSARPAVS